MSWVLFIPILNEKTEGQGDYTTCPKSHCERIWLRFKSRSILIMSLYSFPKLRWKKPKLYYICITSGNLLSVCWGIVWRCKRKQMLLHSIIFWQFSSFYIVLFWFFAKYVNTCMGIRYPKRAGCRILTSCLRFPLLCQIECIWPITDKISTHWSGEAEAQGRWGDGTEVLAL